MPPGEAPISALAPDEIRRAYVLYIGAGAVAAGGIISLVRSLPTIWNALKRGVQDFDLGGKKGGGVAGIPRTERDLSMRFVLIGAVLLIAAIILAPTLHMSIAGALLIVVFGFLFVTVSSRLTGEIGSSSNPISGMTVATLLLTCVIFLLLGWTAPPYYVTALTVGAIVCIAASNGGTTSQDLKTGFLIGSTPRAQQIAILVGTLASALVLGPILTKLNENRTAYLPRVVAVVMEQTEAPLAADKIESLPLYDGPAPLPPDAKLRVLTVDAPPAGETAKDAPEGLAAATYLVDPSSRKMVRKLVETFPEGLRADLSELGAKEPLIGPQAELDKAEYKVWHKRGDEGGLPGKYLVTDDGVPVYFVDSGIAGPHPYKADGQKLAKFPAPSAVVMSYIVKGMLSGLLPWALVLLGVLIAVVLEMAGIPSLAFAVGVYLPLSSSTPILAGGFVRWLVDRHVRNKFAKHEMTEEELVAEGDKSPGVLLASGYIAGGAIVGVIIAFMAGPLDDLSQRIEDWAKAHNPLFDGPWSNALSMIPFTLLALFLFLVGREVLMRPQRPR